MKKIIIVNNNMKVGGVQKSLYNLLWAIHEQYDVTLCLFRALGPYMNQLPPDVKILECKGLFRYLGIGQGECSGVHKLIRGALALTAKLLGRNAAMKLVLAGEKPLPGHYDCAVSYLQNGNIKNFYGGAQEFVLKKVRADKKVAFLHCDYGGCGANHPHNNRLIGQFDRIAACSDGCRRAFEAVMPGLMEKCVTVRNFHRFEEIRALAEQKPVGYDEGKRNVIMVARLAHEKGIERAIAAGAKARDAGVPVMLHIVGGGPMEPMLRERANELDMTERVVFYGEQSNPYRYMVNGDLFLLTSFHEAAPMVIDEAVSLGLPVLTVKTTSSQEMVTDRNAGWVCENSQEALNAALPQVLSHPEKLKEMKNGLLRGSVDNTVAAEQFRGLIEG